MGISVWYTMQVKHFNCTLQVVMMKERDTFVAYCPALDLSTCGSSEKHAKQMFEDAAGEFFRFCLGKGTLEEILQDYGWQKIETDKETLPWMPPHIVSGAREITVSA